MQHILNKAGLVGLSETSATTGPVIAACGGLVGVNGKVTFLSRARLGIGEAKRLLEVLQPDQLILVIPPVHCSLLQRNNVRADQLGAMAMFAILPKLGKDGVVKIRQIGQALQRNGSGLVIRRPGDDRHPLGDGTTVPIIELYELTDELKLHVEQMSD